MSSLTPDISYIYRRKSHRSFSDRPLTGDELDCVLSAFQASAPLIEDIRVSARLVRKEETSVSRGEYCLLVYSEKKTLYLENIGYMLACTDILLQQNGIGSCFLGMGRTKHKEYDGLPFVTMVNIGAMKEDSLRHDENDFQRNDPALRLSALPEGISLPCSLAPSACNSQCWEVRESEDGLLLVRGEGNPSIMRGEIKTFFNKMDMGIFMWYLSTSLSHKGINFMLKLTDSEGKIHIKGDTGATYSYKE